MKRKSYCLLLGIICLSLLAFRATASVYYVNVSNAAPLAPFTTWATAATNIQDAINFTSPGDTVLVTNGTYAFGGLAMAGSLTNRIAFTNAITVQSVNGPWVTTILGAGATNGNSAVRCAWLTNGAALIGFTLTGGATQNSGDPASLESGGGVWCASSNALVANCVLIYNTAWNSGGGIYQGTVSSSLICSNGLQMQSGGISYRSILENCTIVSNAAYGVASPMAMTNCIIYFNGANGSFNYYGLSGSAFSHCCTTPVLPGTANFTTAPQLFADSVHLTTNSPCIGAGVYIPAAGTDVFGNTWSNPPAVGCAEWTPSPLVTTPQIKLTGDPVGFTVGNLAVESSSACTFDWLKDGVPLQDNGHFSGTQTTNMIATGVGFADGGGYQVVVSNSFGVVTSFVAQLVIHCVDVNGTNPIAPYSTWTAAATNIQDAITTATAGDVVLVTNGLYATGGVSMDGVITNRVSVNKAILVQSVNGPNTTIIQGAWDPTSTNGPGAVRCAWLTTNAIMSGFTLLGGATRAYATGGQAINGGGVWGPKTNNLTAIAPAAVAVNCIIISNVASSYGGGAYQVKLNYCAIATNTALGNGASGGSGGGAGWCNLKNCSVTANLAFGSGSSSGGGVDSCNLTNCAMTKNSAVDFGGGAYQSTLVNCSITGNQVGNTSIGYGGGVANSTLVNCIVYLNSDNSSVYSSYSNSYSSTFSYSCTAPAAGGTGNIGSDPQLLADGIHLSATSPCIGAGTASAVTGTDIDGQPWNNPPSIGCDEWQPAPVIAVQPAFQIGSPAHGFTCSVAVAGQAPFTCFWSQDGVPIQDDGHHSNSGTTSLIVNNFGPDDAGSYQVVITNSAGAVTSAVVQLVIHAVDAAGTNPMPPYSSWDTAATTIQDAINVAAPGDIVLVTNGLYATGGMVMNGDLTNRVALNKAITVTSVNGHAATVIQGTWDPMTTNGPEAIRCAYVSDGAVLNGFTLQNGATRATGDGTSDGPLESGGGVYCLSTNGIVSNCVLSNNSAIYGAGLANGTLNNSLVCCNQAFNSGGGTYGGLLNNCTVVNNYNFAGSNKGGGTYSANVRNCVVVDNYFGLFGPIPYYVDNYDTLYGIAQYTYSCSSPTPSGTGNINVNPEFLDFYFHIASTSPCRGMGSSLYASGTDLDGEPWLNPPSMGCDEVIVSNLVGPLSVNIVAFQTNLLVNHYGSFWGYYIGRASTIGWSLGDGTTATNSGGVSHQWTNSGDYTVTFTVYNNDNPAGVSTNLIVDVQPVASPQLQSPFLQTNGFQFQFNGQYSAQYTIQYAANLTPPVAWQTLRTIPFNSQNMVQILDPAWTNSARFYRVLAQ